MIDPTIECAISLSEAGQLLPPGRNGVRPTLSCVLRWVLTGAKSADGSTVKLRAGRCGGRWFTSKEALKAFIEALTPNMEGDSPPSVRTPGARQRASEKAARELEAAGI